MTPRKLITMISFTSVMTISFFLNSPSNAFHHSFQRHSRPSTPISSTAANEFTDISTKDALQRTASHLQKLQMESRRASRANSDDPHAVERDTLYQGYIQQSANSLKDQLKTIGLPRTGRKPELATRLVDYELKKLYSVLTEEEEAVQDVETPWKDKVPGVPIRTFAGLNLSSTAGQALGNADFGEPSPIQAAAIPHLARGQSAILHAQTGSGKTLAYLLPITEQLWKEHRNEDSAGFAVIMTPTRELAAQVAGIAQVLAPPGSVRLIFRPTNLLADSAKERGQDEYGAYIEEETTSRAKPRLFIGSGKGIMHSLYGDGKVPASPTSKPEAMFFLRNVRWLVLDEVDRILHVKKSRGEDRFKQHEKPAAVVTSAVARLTLGRAQIIAASATVGRPLKRELSRVLGLSSQDCPIVIQGSELFTTAQEKDGEKRRSVTIPSVVSHYVTPVKESSSGRLLTASFEVIKQLAKKQRKMLLVLTKGLGMSSKTAIGALKHFQCKPEPVSLLDALEADGTSHLIQLHQQVSGATGVGESIYFEQSDGSSGGEYLLVCGEDSVRGLHLDGLDIVIVVGRPNGPDEYTHIAGRTGRAGKPGSVINVVSNENAGSLKSWEHMLEVEFARVDINDIPSVL